MVSLRENGLDIRYSVNNDLVLERVGKVVVILLLAYDLIDQDRVSGLPRLLFSEPLEPTLRL